MSTLSASSRASIATSCDEVASCATAAGTVSMVGRAASKSPLFRAPAAAAKCRSHTLACRSHTLHALYDREKGASPGNFSVLVQK